MAYFVTTLLGREVPLGDWRALHRDTILRVLCDLHTSPHNPRDLPLGLEALCNVTGLAADDTKTLVDALVSERLVEVDPSGEYRITGEGVVLVRNAPGQLPRAGGMSR